MLVYDSPSKLDALLIQKSGWKALKGFAAAIGRNSLLQASNELKIANSVKKLS